MNWTNAQNAAIYTTDTNVIVSAAAGSGKTAVLTERIVNLVRAGTDIDHFLVVTFTEAATTEMKRRIGKRLIACAQSEENPAAAQRLREQAGAADRANISTLHAFCLYILRRNFHRLGLDPAFSVADELMGSLLFRQAFEETAEAHYEKQDAGFFTLLNAFDGSQDKLFIETARVKSFLEAQPAPAAWLQHAVAAYLADEEFDEYPVRWRVIRGMLMDTAALTQRYANTRRLVPDSNQKICALIDEELASLRALAFCRDTADCAERLNAVQFAMMKGFSKSEEAIKNAVAAARDMVKRKISDLKEMLATPAEQELARMRLLAPAVAAFAAFVQAVLERYAALKRERTVVDYADMEHFALTALAHEDVRTALKNRFRYILVDEYQDSSAIQECIIEQVRRESNLFLVGDVKQSIYSFRQAEPALFLAKMRDYTGEAAASGTQVYLNTNFRSEQPVIDAVNELFSAIMTEQAAEMDYDENARLNRPAHSGDIPQEVAALIGAELHVIEKHAAAKETPATNAEPEEEETEAAEENEEFAEAKAAREAAESLEDAEAEALIAAQRIHALMQTCRTTESGKPRALCYADFVVLLRSSRSRNAGEVWAKTLLEQGIPSYVQLTGGFFDAIEVHVFLNLLRVIDNRRQDIPLLSVLRLPLFGFDEDMLVRLRKDCPAETLFESLCLCAEETGMLAMRVRAVFKLLQSWQTESRLLPLEEFLALVLEESGLYECMGTLTGAKQRQANLDAVLMRAREYAARAGACDLWSFITYMDDAANTAKMGGASTAAADVVRIMTIHKSKGLEFPVVILGGMGVQFNKTAQSAPILCDRELGIGVRLTADGVQRQTLLHKAIGVKQNEKSLAEEMRVLYVAMTRARERLILLGTKKNAQLAVSEARSEPVRPHTVARAKSSMDWLLPVFTKTPTVSVSLHPVCTKAGEVQLPPLDEHGGYAEMLAQLQERFAWKYPYAADTAIPSKMNVSALLHTHEVSLKDPPRFTAEKRMLTPAERGSALHVALSELAPVDCPDEQVAAFVEREIGRMVMQGLLGGKQASSLPKRDMEWLLTSEIGKRMRTAERLERELEFSVEAPANTLIDVTSETPLLLQGVIDCCFLESGEWVVLDYKTDRVREGVSAEEAAEAHAAQLRLYAGALERLTGKNVKELLVVMIRSRAVCAVEK